MALPPLHNAKFRLASLVARHRLLYFPLERLRRGRFGKLVDESTQVTIEGFPRSGTSFAVRAFEFANPAARIAHHKHALAQIEESTRRGLPTLVIVRQPAASVRSLLVRRPQIGKELVLTEWIAFHQRIQRLREALVLVSFDAAIENFGPAIQRLNARFDAHFQDFVHNDVSVAAVFKAMENHNLAAFGRLRHTHIPRPDATRETLKNMVSLRGLENRLAQALEIYEDLIMDPATPLGNPR